MLQKNMQFSTSGLSVGSSRLGSPTPDLEAGTPHPNTQKQSFFAVLLTYAAYYTCSLLWNACLIAFYTVQVFTNHQACYTKTSRNITDRFEFAFQVGFAVHIADFMNTNLVGIYLKSRMAQEERSFGFSKDSTYGLMMVSAYAEWVFRISIIAVSCLQMLILHQNTSQYCIQESGVLALENDWL